MKKENQQEELKLTPYIQEHVNWVTAIRTGKYISDAEACA
jgi:hypothetical protein